MEKQIKRLTNSQIDRIIKAIHPDESGICFQVYSLFGINIYDNPNKVKILFGKKFPPARNYHYGYSWHLNETGYKKRIEWLKSCKQSNK